MLAVAHHRDAVGDQQRLLQRVADEDDRDAALLQPLDEREELVLLLGRQRRRRLVEDDHLRIVVHRARDLDHLLLAGAEARDHRGRIDVEVQRLQELLAGDVDAAQPVEALLVGQVDVLRDGQRRHQAGLLVDHRDAALQRLRRRCRARPSRRRSRSRRRSAATTPAIILVSVDLPAPFSPSSACTSPR